MRRAPSVQDYARMAERARLAAVEIAAAQVAALETRRDALTGGDWVRYLHADAEHARAAAVERHPEDTPEVCRRRVLDAHTEAAAAAHRNYLRSRAA